MPPLWALPVLPSPRWFPSFLNLLLILIGFAVCLQKESKAVLMKPPFDQPILFTRLFDGKTGSELMDTINSVKENATHVTA